MLENLLPVFLQRNVLLADVRIWYFDCHRKCCKIKIAFSYSGKQNFGVYPCLLVCGVLGECGSTITSFEMHPKWTYRSSSDMYSSPLAIMLNTPVVTFANSASSRLIRPSLFVSVLAIRFLMLLSASSRPGVAPPKILRD